MKEPFEFYEFVQVKRSRSLRKSVKHIAGYKGIVIGKGVRAETGEVVNYTIYIFDEVERYCLNHGELKSLKVDGKRVVLTSQQWRAINRCIRY